MTETVVTATAAVLNDVLNERLRQEQIGIAKRAAGVDWRSCADPEMAGGDDKRYVVLGEEFGEVAKALLESTVEQTMTEADLREELIQLAACSVAWAEAIDARQGANL